MLTPERNPLISCCSLAAFRYPFRHVPLYICLDGFNTILALLYTICIDCCDNLAFDFDEIVPPVDLDVMECVAMVLDLPHCLVASENVTLIPFVLKDVAGIDSLNLPDGIHPNAIGEKIVAENIWEFLVKLL